MKSNGADMPLTQKQQNQIENHKQVQSRNRWRRVCNPCQQEKPSGTFFPQELNTRLMATDTLNFRRPNTFPLIAVHRHNAASRSAMPSKTAQHSLLGSVPITSWRSPSQSPQTPNLRVSLGHLAGVGEGGNGAGFGVGGHVAQPNETQLENSMLSMMIAAATGFSFRPPAIFLSSRASEYY